MPSWLTAILALLAAYPCLALNKCCPVGELMTGYEGCAPVNVSADRFDLSDPWWWVDKHSKQGLKLGRTRVGEAVRPRCNIQTRKMLMNEDEGDDFWENFRLVHANDTDDVKLEVEVVSSTSKDEDAVVWHAFDADAFCVDAIKIKDSKSLDHAALLCPCADALACVRKCCPTGRQLDLKNNKCVDDTREGAHTWLPAFDPEAKLEHRFVHLDGRSPLCAENETTTMTMGASLGVVLQRDGGIKVNHTQETLERDKFCGDSTPDGREVLVHCMRVMTQQEVMVSTVYLVLFATGSVALLLTVLVSLLLPDLRRKVHARMALAHNAALLVGYVAIGSLHVVGTYGRGMSTNACKVLGLVIQFSILASFFWLNVMCIDIFWAFSGLRAIQGSMMQQDKKKFAYYSVYAWGATGLISLATIGTEFGAPKSALLRPAFGEGRAHFFNNRGAMVLFFYGPMAALLAINFGLFVYTAFKIWQAKQASAILHTADSATSRKNKQRLTLYVKLFCLMGVTWVFEVVSFAVEGHQLLWLAFDAVNLSRAVFVFVIFCCKKTVWDKLLRRLGCASPLLPGASSYSGSTRTTSSAISRTRTLTPGVVRKTSERSIAATAL